jgi:hypothetical protein
VSGRICKSLSAECMNRAKLESLFRRYCRLVIRDSGWPPLTDNKSLYYLLDVLPLRFLFQYTSAVMLYKIIVLREIPELLSPFTTVDSSSRLVPDSIIVHVCQLYIHMYMEFY